MCFSNYIYVYLYVCLSSSSLTRLTPTVCLGVMCHPYLTWSLDGEGERRQVTHIASIHGLYGHVSCTRMPHFHLHTSLALHLVLWTKTRHVTLRGQTGGGAGVFLGKGYCFVPIQYVITLRN